MLPTEVKVGYIFRYSYLWHWQHLEGREEGGKDRPCLVLAIVTTEEDGSPIVRVLPITHTAPANPDDALEIPLRVKSRLGLDDDRSWIVLTEAIASSAANRPLALACPLGAYNPLGYIKHMQTVAETLLFIKQAAELFSDDERKELIDFLATNPQVGDEIPGSGGVRKIRFGSKGKGKRGGARVIYYWYSDDTPIYALLAYGKNEKVDLKPDEAKAVAAFARAIKAANRSRT